MMHKMMRSAGVALGAALLLSACSERPTAEGDAVKLEPDPQLGMVTTISAEKVKQAAGLVKEGKTYALGVITGPDSVAYPGRSFAIETFGAGSKRRWEPTRSPRTMIGWSAMSGSVARSTASDISGATVCTTAG